MFSYGSGVSSSMFVLRVRRPLSALATKVNQMLSDRKKIHPKDYSLLMKEREQNYNAFNFKPKFESEDTRNDSFILRGVDELGRRSYGKYSNSISQATGGVLHPRILSISRQLVKPRSTAKKAAENSMETFDKKFSNFYKKTMSERMSLVSPVLMSVSRRSSQNLQRIPSRRRPLVRNRGPND